MENNIFKAGVAPGSPTTQNEVKMLVCYILSKIQKPMSFSQLHQALAEHNLVNYFDLVAVMEELAETGHVSISTPQEAECYLLTDAGLGIAREFTTALPLSVREKALEAAQRLLRQQQRLEEVRFQAVAQPGGGYLLHLSIPNGEGTASDTQGEQLISFTVFAPSAAERDLIRRRFLNDPLFLYKGVLSLLTGSREVLGELLPGREDLF